MFKCLAKLAAWLSEWECLSTEKNIDDCGIDRLTDIEENEMSLMIPKLSSSAISRS